MCGIAGFLAFDGELSRERAMPIITAMTDIVRYRGPDDEGHLVDGPIALGHRRLSIIDLDQRSAQPLSTTDGALSVVFNGEIYNYRDVRDELRAAGHGFRTESDTEVLLHAYREWGTEMVHRLRGMFAFGIWDHEARRLFLARDRFGKKPLFVYRDAEKLIFASEIKSILRYPDLPREINHQSVYDYLSFGYCIGEETAFSGISRVPPAHMMVVEADGTSRTERYWELAGIDPDMRKHSRDELAEQLIERFDEALRYRLVADVPVGAFLSGGVDSSAVVARMAPMMSHTLKTFSVGFDIEGFDETEYAREVAERYETEHHSFTMDYDLIDQLPKLIWHYGEPYADSSAIVTYALAREVRKHVTVGMTGDGGDEILLGYSRYQVFRDTVKDLDAGKTSFHHRYKIGLGQSLPLMRDHYARSMFKFRNEHMLWGAGEALLPYLFNQAADGFGTGLEGATVADALDRAARADCRVYLPDDLLVKADIATMANSLEGRSPFLDHVFADWAASLPQNKRVFWRKGKLQSKGLLKYALEPHLPHGCMYRKKMGFSVPVGHWMRNEIREFLIDTLTSERFFARGFVTREFTHHMIDRHMEGIENHGTRLWVLLCLEMWCQTFIDHDGSAPLDLDVTGQAPRMPETRERVAAPAAAAFAGAALAGAA